jgi:hypothetical protein
MGGYCKDCGNQHCICDAMEKFIERDFLNGARIDYDKIETILKADEVLWNAWADNCGIDKFDDRCIYGWPYLFEKFYDGYNSRKISKIYIVQKRLTKYGYEYVDALCFFTEYKKAIEYIKTLPEEHNVSYDIEEVESK